MSEELKKSNGSKRDKYLTLLPQIEAVIAGEDDAIACMANVAAMLYETFRFWWVGFYRVIADELVLGPFQGPMACTRIAYGRGVCGTAWKEGATVIVPDVELFPGHIACSSFSRSEIVVPISKSGNVVGVIDIDSERPANFDDTDKEFIEKLATLLSPKL